jgi:outer membrane protein
MRRIACLLLTMGIGALWPGMAAGQSFMPGGQPQTAASVAQPARPAFADDARIGFVDIERVAALSNEGKAAAARIQQLRNKKAAELADRGKQVDSLQQKLSQGTSVLNDAARARLQREFERSRIDYQRLNEDAQAEVQDTQQQLLQAFTARLFRIVGEVASEKKLWAVFSNESNLVWHNPALDLSEEVAKRLDVEGATKQK